MSVIGERALLTLHKKIKSRKKVTIPYLHLLKILLSFWLAVEGHGNSISAVATTTYM